MNYRREIDGLRAIAVLPVILFHAGFSLFSGGFVGVDVFFVISGYLITTIIVSEMQDNQFRLSVFYERRAKRILPALIVVVVSSVPLVWLFFTPLELHVYSGSLMSVATFSSNFFFWRSSGYFDASSELQPLLHTWSLAVEEQYYLLFPLGLMLVWRFNSKGLWVAISIAAVFSFSLSQWAVLHKPSAAFYLLPARGWELLVGSFAALYMLGRRTAQASRALAEVGSLLGMAMIACAIFLFDKKTAFPGVNALIPTVGTALIIVFSSENTWVGRALSARALVGVGLVSYSAYLWHQPLFALVQYQAHDGIAWWAALGLIGIVFVLAFITWKYVEEPVRKAKGLGGVESFCFLSGGYLLFFLWGCMGISMLIRWVTGTRKIKIKSYNT